MVPPDWRGGPTACQPLQRNQRGEFTSGVQLYDYLQSHKCIGLTAGRARVHANQGQYVCIYDPKDKQDHQALRLDAKRYAVEVNNGVNW